MEIITINFFDNHKTYCLGFTSAIKAQFDQFIAFDAPFELGILKSNQIKLNDFKLLHEDPVFINNVYYINFSKNDELDDMFQSTALIELSMLTHINDQWFLVGEPIFNLITHQIVMPNFYKNNFPPIDILISLNSFQELPPGNFCLSHIGDELVFFNVDTNEILSILSKEYFHDFFLNLIETSANTKRLIQTYNSFEAQTEDGVLEKKIRLHFLKQYSEILDCILKNTHENKESLFVEIKHLDHP